MGSVYEHPDSCTVERGVTERNLMNHDSLGAITDGRESTMSAMPTCAIGAAEQAAEAVRAANHASLHRGDFDHHDLYRLVGELSTLTQRLPQLLDQTGDILVHLHEAGRIDVDHGSLDDVVTNWTEATSAAVSVAFDLVRQVDRAFAQLSAVRASALDCTPG